MKVAVVGTGGGVDRLSSSSRASGCGLRRWMPMRAIPSISPERHLIDALRARTNRRRLTGGVEHGVEIPRRGRHLCL